MYLKGFLCGISLTLSRPAKFIYLFIYLFVHEKDLLVTWFLFGVQRAEKTGFQLVFLHSRLYGGHLSSQLWDYMEFHICFPGLFVSKLFSIFTGSLRALAFRFCYGTRN